MLDLQRIKISDYNYSLEDIKIAKYPLAKRDDSQLLYYRNNKIEDKKFSQLANLLPDNTCLIFNNTRVIRARLLFKKETGAKIEIFCLEPFYPSDYVQIFESTSSCQWHCMVGNARKWKQGDLSMFIQIEGEELQLKARKIKDDIIEFSWNNKNFNFGELIEATGVLPIPPYLNRETEENDLQSYQTVYSKIKGSVAAPTAGLHFTDEVLKDLDKKEIIRKELTLHVGAGTFKPVKTDTIKEHHMHIEHFVVSKDLINTLLSDKFIIPVGTTTVRTLESLYYLGVKILENKINSLQGLLVDQWDPYNLSSQYSKTKVLKALLLFMEQHQVSELQAATQIMIVPSYQFKFTQAIITNFHQPKSTLLLLIAALIGKEWKTIYQHALDNNYRFLSYGDSSILFPSSK